MSDDQLEQFREAQEFIADSLGEPIIRVKSSRAELTGGYQAFFDFMVIHRPKVITVIVEEWENLDDLASDIAGSSQPSQVGEKP